MQWTTKYYLLVLPIHGCLGSGCSATSYYKLHSHSFVHLASYFLIMRRSYQVCPSSVIKMVQGCVRNETHFPTTIGCHELNLFLKKTLAVSVDYHHDSCR